jgi:hypothetical protein
VGCASETPAEAPKAPDAPKAQPAPEPTTPKADEGVKTVDFATNVAPNLNKFCTPCHAGAGAKGGLDVTAIKSNEDAKAKKDLLAKAASEVESKKMPPAKSANQPTDEERAALVAGLKGV